MRWLLAALLLVVALVLVTAAWLFYTEPGLRWTLALAQDAARGKLRVEGARGALAREIEIDALLYQDGKTEVALRDATLRLELLAFLGARAGIHSLQAKSLAVTLPAAGDAPGAPPEPPQLPLGLRIERADIARITLERGAERYVIEDFELRDTALLQSGTVAATAAFELRHAQYPVSARLRIGGTVERLEVGFEGRIGGIPAKLRAQVSPFAPRPLAAIDAEAGPVDLQRLNAEWPATQLSVKLAGKSSPTHALAGSLSARNAAPGPLDEKRIPLASLETRFASTDLQSAALQELKMALSPGGTLAGKGALSPGKAEFDLRVSNLDLRSFGAKLRATQLSGNLRLGAGEVQTLQGTLAQQDMKISADIVRDGERVDIRSLRAEAQGGAATGTASLRLTEPLRFEARLKLEHFDPARFGEYPGGDINGAVEGSGTLGADPAVEARWTIADSTLQGEALQSRGSARLSRSRATRVAAEAVFGGARLGARGDLGAAGDELAWTLEVPRIEHFLEEFAGRLQASGTLSGSLDAPQGTIVARASALRLPQGMSVKSATAKARGSLARRMERASGLVGGDPRLAQLGRLSAGARRARAFARRTRARRARPARSDPREGATVDR